MFDQLRRAFSNAARNVVQKELTEKDINNILSDLEIALLQSDIAQEVIDDLGVKLKADLVGMKLEKGQNAESIINSGFRKAVVELFSKAGKIDLLQEIKEKKDKKKGPLVIAFLGINGTGKTTTVAKVAQLLRKNNISVVLAAADTHRAGAIEQLSRHAERLSLKLIAQRYGADPSAVGRDAIDYAKKHYADTVLVDTAGRMQTAKNLMEEINKIVRVVKPDIKLFVGDALAGNDTINQARDFFKYTDFDGAILTKIDADAKGGAAISIVHITSKPIVYLGIGQGYDDIITFSSERFIDSIFRDIPLAGTHIDIPIPASRENSPNDNIAKHRQESEKQKAQGMSEDLIVSGNTHESSQLEDPYSKNEKQDPDLPNKEEKDVTSSLDEAEQATRSSPTIPPLSVEINPYDKLEKNKKSRFKGLFGSWKNKNKRTEVQSKDAGQKEDSLKEAVKKVKDDPEHKKKVDRDNGEIVYLSDEDIEDMLK